MALVQAEDGHQSPWDKPMFGEVIFKREGVQASQTYRLAFAPVPPSMPALRGVPSIWARLAGI